MAEPKTPSGQAALGASLRVVIVSGNASDSVLDACLSAGAAACVRKPFSSDQLRSQLEGWLAESAQSRPATLVQPSDGASRPV